MLKTAKLSKMAAAKPVAVLVRKKGQPIGRMDLLIAMHALALDVILITNNLREFGRIPHLRLENWAE